MSLWLELQTRKHIESKRGQLRSHHTGPKIPIGSYSLQGIDHDTGEVNVADNHNVILPEKCQLHQIHRSLAICPGRLAQVLDRPDNGEQHRAAANHIHQQEDLLPSNPVLAKWAGLIDHNLSDIRDDLERNNNHQHLLLLALQIGLQEGPASSDQNDQCEKRNSFQEVEYVEQDVPAVRCTSPLDIRLVLRFAEQVQSFKDEDGEHEEMDTENGEPFLVEDVNPKAAKSEVHQREEEVNPRQKSFSSGEIVATLALAVEIVHGGSDVHGDLELWNTVGKEEDELIGVGLRKDSAEALLSGVVFEATEGVDLLDHVGIEGALDLSILQLLEHVEPRFAGAEEETHLRELRIGNRVGVGEPRHVELQAPCVGESELVEGNDGPVVVSDLGDPDLGEAQRDGNRHANEEEIDAGREGHGRRRSGSVTQTLDSVSTTTRFEIGNWKLEIGMVFAADFP